MGGDQTAREAQQHDPVGADAAREKDPDPNPIASEGLATSPPSATDTASERIAGEPAAPAPPLDWRDAGLGLAVSVVAVLALYARTLSYDWMWDDGSLIVGATWQSSPTALKALWTSDFWLLSDSPYRSGMYRPFITFGYWLESELAGEPVASLSRAFNLGWLSLLGAVSFLLGRALGATRAAAALLAVALVAHPAAAETVTYVSGRTDSVSLAFLLGACLFATGPLTPLRGLGAALLLLLGMLSKEAALVAPALILPVHLLARRGRPGNPLGWFGLAVACSAAIMALRSALDIGSRLLWEQWNPLDGPWRTLRYLAYSVFPVETAPVIEWPDATTATGLGAALVLVALLALAWRRRAWDVLFAFVWFGVGAALVADWLPIKARLSPALALIPLTGLVLMFALRATSRARLAGFGAWVALLVALNVPWTAAWRDNLVLWTWSVQAAPNDAKGPQNLATALLVAERLDEAEHWYREAVRLADDREAHITRARAWVGIGRIAEARKDAEAALAAHRKALEVSGDEYHPARVRLAYVLMQTGDRDGAFRQAQAAFRQAPSDRAAITLLAWLAGVNGHYVESLAGYRLLARRFPKEPYYREMIAYVEARMRETPPAATPTTAPP